MAKGATLGTKIQKASPWKRIFAFLIDLIILNVIVIWPFRAVLNSLMPSGSFASMYASIENNPVLVSQINSIYFYIGALAFLYFTISEARLGQSIGKKIIGLYVVSGNREASLWQIMFRNLFLFPVFPLALIWIIDPLMMIFWKGRLSDVISRTQVVVYERKVFVEA